MKRERFTAAQVGESFLHAYAFHLGDTEFDAPVIVSHGDERHAGIFDLLSEAKKAAKRATKEAERTTGSKGWEWFVDRRELASVQHGSRGSWAQTAERWSSVGGHEGRETFGNALDD